MNKMPRAIPKADAKHYGEQMAKPDLVFLTEENKDRVGARVKKEMATNGDEDSTLAADKGTD